MKKYEVPYIEVKQNSGVYFVPGYAEHRPASKAILNGGVFEPETHRYIEEALKDGGNIIHAGTFFGDMLPNFSKFCKGNVYAFEPVLENYVLAKQCVEENDLKNVFLLNAGLSNVISTGRINTGSENSHLGGASKLSEDKGQKVSLLTIDCLNIENLKVIQLDIEGHELPALKGAIETIHRNRPIIMIEDYNRTCDSFLNSIEYKKIKEIPGLSIWK